MTTAEVTLAFQLVTLAMLVSVTVSIYRTHKSLRGSARLIEAFRHDLDWLLARVDELELKVRRDASK